jgi:hypothetical protein
MNFGAIGQYLKSAFSDNGNPSSSRLLTVPHSLVACGCLIYVVIKTHGFPDGTVLAGLGAFATAHYAINRATTAFGKDKKDKDKTDVNVQVDTKV